jgi:hypothetical protein
MFANRFVKYAVTAPRASIRLMSGHKGTPAEMRADVNRWKQISVGENQLQLLSMQHIHCNSDYFWNRKSSWRTKIAEAVVIALFCMVNY